MKIAFGMIVFEGDYVLKECLEQVYPFAEQILIAEGPVEYWQRQGRTTSTDNTNKILEEFPDPENKIKVVHGQFKEKDDQCRAYMQHINDDIDYLWNLDSDEVYKTKDLENIIKFLEEEKPTSVGIRSLSFYGGFENYLTGFELKKDNFLRIFRFTKGSTWLTHRPPTIKYPEDSNIIKKHIDSDTLFQKTGAQMYHYSYVFPRQVHTKISYYKDSVSRQNCLDNYFKRVYLPWILSDEKKRKKIEDKYRGVHEFKPEVRGDCYTAKFTDKHPEAIQKNLSKLNDKIDVQLKELNIQKERKLKTDYTQSWKESDSVFDMQLELNKSELKKQYPIHWNSFLELMRSIETQPKSILDIGCGVGAFHELCRKEFPDVEYHGIDYSKKAIEIAKREWSENSFSVMDYNELSKEDIEKFDVVHMGAFLDVLPNGDEVLEFILSLEPKNVIIGRMKTTDAPSHYKTYKAYDSINTYAYYHNKNSILRMCAKYGYDIEHINDNYLLTKTK